MAPFGRGCTDELSCRALGVEGLCGSSNETTVASERPEVLAKEYECSAASLVGVEGDIIVQGQRVSTRRFETVKQDRMMI